MQLPAKKEYSLLKGIKTEFFKNSMILFVGSFITQAVSVLLYPLFTRLYSPEQFGTFALFMSITNIVIVLSTGNYEQAILLPKEDKKAFSLIFLTLLISSLVSLLFLIFAVIFKNYIAENIIRDNYIKPFLALIPVSVFLNSVYLVLVNLSNRNKHYSLIARGNVNLGFSNNAGKLLFGFTGLNNIGLITGRLIGQFTSSLQLLIEIRKKMTIKNIFLNRFHFNEIADTGRFYGNFPRYRMPHSLLNIVSSSLPIFVLARYFSTYDAGQFSLAIGILLTPVQLITNSVSKVLNQKIVEHTTLNKKIFNQILQQIKRLIPVFAVLFVLLYFVSDPVFIFLFGKKWQLAGTYFKVILPWIFLVLCATPFSFIPNIFSKQKKAMIIDIIYFILRSGSLATGIFYQNDILGIRLFVLSGVIILTYNFFWYLSFLRNFDRKISIENPL